MFWKLRKTRLSSLTAMRIQLLLSSVIAALN